MNTPTLTCLFCKNLSAFTVYNEFTHKTNTNVKGKGEEISLRIVSTRVKKLNEK